jgi:hypothetical protein
MNSATTIKFYRITSQNSGSLWPYTYFFSKIIYWRQNTLYSLQYLNRGIIVKSRSALLLFIIIAISSISTFSYQEKYESLFVSEDALESDSFEYEVYQPGSGEYMLTPFGNSDYPHTAIARVSRNRISPDVVYLTDVQSAFAATQDEVERSLPDNFYAIEDGMVFLASDGQTVVDPSFASYAMILDVTKKAIAGLVNIAWGTINECSNKPFTSNYSGIKCSNARGMDPGFKKFINKNILSCINSGLKATGKKSAKSAHIVHGGIGCNKLHSKKSLHCAHRAIDIRTIIAKDSAGKDISIDYPTAKNNKKSWERNFYQSFGVCWSNKNIERDSKCKNSGYLNGQVGIIRWENKKHGKHMHVSMPACGSSKYLLK